MHLRAAARAVGLVLLLLVGFVSPTHVPAVAMQPAEVSSVYVRIPQSAQPDQPLRVLVALHGMGGDGQTFANDVAAAADRNGSVPNRPPMLMMPMATKDWAIMAMTFFSATRPP